MVGLFSAQILNVLKTQMWLIIAEPLLAHNTLAIGIIPHCLPKPPMNPELSAVWVFPQKWINLYLNNAELTNTGMQLG